MARIAELRAEATKLAEQIQQQNTQYNERKKAHDGHEGEGDAPALWPEQTRQQWLDTNARYDSAIAELEQLEGDAEMVERAAAVADWLQRSQDPGRRPTLDDQVPGGDGGSYGDAGFQNRDQATAYEQRQRDLSLCFQAWAQHGVPDTRMTDSHREAAERQQFNPHAQGMQLRMCDTEDYRRLQRKIRSTHPDRRGELFDDLLETRALNSGVGASGGFVTVPATLVRSIELAQIEFGALLEFVDTITTETGEEMGWPVGDDTSNEASYTDENVQITTDQDPSFEQVKWGAHDLKTGFIKIPFRMMRDSAVNLEVIVGRMIGERFGRKVSGEATTGVAKIRGLQTRAPVGHTAAAAAAITHADITGVEHSVDPALRARLAYMFHDDILEQLRLLTDSQNRPLWISNLASGAPDTFNGRRYVINQKMVATMASGTVSVIAGDFSSYKLRRVGPSLRLRRLVERFADFDQTAFIGFQSVDGNLLRPNSDTACPVQKLDHP